MKKNVGSVDRMIRIILGMVIILLGIRYDTLWGLIGIIPLATGLFSWCPVYKLFGITTCTPRRKGAQF